MNSSWFFEHNFNGVPDDFFDDALKYVDFPLENLESDDAIEDWESQFQHVPTPFNLFADFTSGIRDQNFKDASLTKSSVLSDKSSRPKAWLKTAKASSGRNIPLKYDASEVKYARLLWTSSPVSVLESSSSSSSTENLTACHFKFTFPVKRPRSKCLRRRRCTYPFIPMFYTPKQHILGAYESESESCPDEKLNFAKKRKKKKNLTLLSSTVEMDQLSSGEIRKCSHCEVTKTPQWREGPMGPKTLCNACGVRYRSGRLFPEYRPAASPTFVPMLHSNSHRKVIEMRKNAQCSSDMAATKTAKPPLPEYSF